jgi:hypothetical protein
LLLMVKPALCLLGLADKFLCFAVLTGNLLQPLCQTG